MLEVKRFFFKFEVVFISIVIGLLCLFCFGSAIGHEILYWDSSHYVHLHDCVQRVSFRNIWCILSEPYFANWHPVTTYTYMLENEFGGGSPKVFHATNIILHVVNSVIFYFLTKKAMLYHGVEFDRAFLTAIFSSVLFAVHTQHVENVMWVAERKGLLNALFFLLTIMFYFSYVEEKLKNKKYGSARKYYLISLVTFILSLLSKPMTVTVPVILLLIDVYPLRRLNFDAGWAAFFKQSFQLVFEKAPFFIFSFVMAIITFLIQESHEAVVSVDNFPIITRVVNGIYGLYFYVAKWVFPVSVYPFYDHPSFIINSNLAILVPFLICFVVVVGALVYWFVKGKHLYLFLFMFYFVALLPVIGLVKVGSASVADRYAYIPTMPFYIVVAGGVCVLLFSAKQKIKALGGFGVGVVFFSLVILTKEQVSYWHTNLSIWQYTNHQWLKSNKDSQYFAVMPLHNLAIAYFHVDNCERTLEYLVDLEENGAFYKQESYLLMAECYERLGYTDFAIQGYKFLIEKGGVPDEYRQKAREKLGNLIVK